MLKYRITREDTQGFSITRGYSRNAQPVGRIRPPKDFYPALGAG